jgi:hypothetical protein
VTILNKIKANFYLNLKCSKSFLLTSLLCVIPFFTFFILITIHDEFNNTGDTYVSCVIFIYLLMELYLIVQSVSAPRGVFTYSLRMGSTRKEYFLGSAAFYVLIAAAFSLVYTILFIFENILLKCFGVNQMNNYSFISDKINFTSSLRITLLNFLIFTAIISVMTMLSYMAYIFGRYGWLVIILYAIALFLILKLYPGTKDIIKSFRKTDFNINSIDLIITFIASAISYFVIGKTQLRKA